MQLNRASNLMRIVLWSLAGMVVLLVLTLTVTAATLPGCTGCHASTDFVAQTVKSPHAAVSCTSCHVESGVVPRFTYAYRIVFGMTLGLAPAGPGTVAGVPDRTCLSCHAKVMTRVVSVSGVSIAHRTCSKGRMCTDCHSDTGHGTAVKWVKTPQMFQCLECHQTAAVRADCGKCHAARTDQQRLRTGIFLVTHGADWKRMHGMGDLTSCVACHPNTYCVQCHGMTLPHDAAWLRLHPATALRQRSTCTVCHQQAFCDGCHGIPMPHAKTFTPTHPALVNKQGSTVCLRCHVTKDCDTCHIKHMHPGEKELKPSSGAQ